MRHDPQFQNETDPNLVKPLPIKKLSLLRVILTKLPSFCAYCGRHYTRCYSREAGLYPLPLMGKCCPNGHEGYIDEYIGHSKVRKRFDMIKT